MQNDTNEVIGVSSAEGMSISSTETFEPKQEPMDSNVTKPKKNRAMIVGMVLLAILAVGGIGFGIWAMMDGNAKVAKKDGEISNLNNQISSLTQEKSDLTERVAELEASNKEAQENIAQNEEIIKADEEKIKEEEAIIAEDQQREAEGYQVKSIDSCVLDTGTVGAGSTVLKCNAVTSLGNGKFVYDSQSNKLRFVIFQ